ncbi:MAG TPA: L-rhamnose mutarotase [Cyclobacteriaceae bacterium]|nr:L-rhamnose mutarotase [Cyclobacteriaceae bacterium]
MKTRHGFKMKLYPGFMEEYKKRHDELWPEMARVIREQGIENYSIFLDEETNILFSYYEQTGSNTVSDYASSEIVKKWWKYMADIMETNPDHSPVTIPLEPMFYLR